MTATPAGMTYADYLALDQLLTAQKPLSDLHDEMRARVIVTECQLRRRIVHRGKRAHNQRGGKRYPEDSSRDGQQRTLGYTPDVVLRHRA